MSGKDNFNKDELIKSLAETLSVTEEVAAEMINSGSQEEDTGLEKSQKGNKEEKEDEYSEDAEKEMEKAMNAAKDAYETYKAKKPKAEVQKSEDLELGAEKSNNDDLLKSFEGMFSDLTKSFGEKFDSLEKSLETIEELKEELSLVKGQMDEIGKYTPEPKSFGMNNQAIIEKAMAEGVEEDGYMKMSAKAHKEKVSDMLVELIEESEGELQKALDTDLSNYVSGAGNLGDTAKRILKEKKKVIVR